MDGKELLYRLRQLLNEDSDSAFLDNRTSYTFLWEAAKEFVAKTNCLRAEQSITTVADQDTYTLNADFMKLYLRDRDGLFFIKYNDGSNNHFLLYKSYEEMVYEDYTTSVARPTFFTILDQSSLASRVSGTAVAAGAAAGGQCTLSDTSSSTKFANVSAGDIVHNTTDGCDGVVLSKTSNTALVTALFGGAGNDWAQNDAYWIQPQGRMQLKIYPPPLTAGHTITIAYVQIPAPVFSEYGIYRFQQGSMDALLKLAAWLYKFRDRELDYGDKWFQYAERQIRRLNSTLRDSINHRDFRVSFKGRKR